IMAVTFSTPENCFIKFDEVAADDCKIPFGLCIPINSMDDIDFQIIATPSPYEIFDEDAYEIRMVASCGDTEFLKETPFSSPAKFADLSWVETDNGEHLAYLSKNDSLDLEALTGDLSCFRLVVVSISNDAILACSNCLVYLSDTCFTTVVKYRCDENSFGF